MGWQVAITDQADADLGNVVAFLARKSPAGPESRGARFGANGNFMGFLEP
jgi:hypothetical protein